ncbi:hypothetical protein KIN20_033868 [Parelaphostrongylus tenuis]|uniref:Uncharacterized protein n=1 Tax=Parelaphostrongylus tenuis TaxID=148309 RepID=A0AAD5R8Z9_PARTN|nr:hypothetical protein KIN20_033868 [Parelaphostrongylus tenuis]
MTPCDGFHEVQQLSGQMKWQKADSNNQRRHQCIDHHFSASPSKFLLCELYISFIGVPYNGQNGRAIDLFLRDVAILRLHS